MLHTDWVKVATAGKTVDGRKIEAQWLKDAAATYSPQTYTASVNSEHFFFPGLGLVRALKAERDEQERMALYAQIEPTAELLRRYQNKRQLFFSMELREGFPAKGDHYLTGLAITDMPASQGLQPVQYAAGAEDRERFYDTATLESKEPQFRAVAENPPRGLVRQFGEALYAVMAGNTKKEAHEMDAKEETQPNAASETQPINGELRQTLDWMQQEQEKIREALKQIPEIRKAQQLQNEKIQQLQTFLGKPVGAEAAAVTAPAQQDDFVC